jgi:hypothetical protein
MRWIGAAALGGVVVLIVVGFALGGYLDAGGSSLPGLQWFMGLPKPIRVILEILIVAPIMLGVVLYFVTQMAEFLWWLAWPLRRARSNGNRGRASRTR